MHTHLCSVGVGFYFLNVLYSEQCQSQYSNLRRVYTKTENSKHTMKIVRTNNASPAPEKSSIKIKWNNQHYKLIVIRLNSSQICWIRSLNILSNATKLQCLLCVLVRTESDAKMCNQNSNKGIWAGRSPHSTREPSINSNFLSKSRHQEQTSRRDTFSSSLLIKQTSLFFSVSVQWRMSNVGESWRLDCFSPNNEKSSHCISWEIYK